MRFNSDIWHKELLTKKEGKIIMRKSTSLNELKNFMQSGNIFYIEDWNARREEAKQYFTRKAICELDSSGLVKELVQYSKL